MSIESFRWWHIEEVLALETQLFQPDPWSAQHFWSELGQTSTRRYVVAVQDGIVGYGGYCDYPDEGFIQTLAVAPDHQGKGIGALLLDDLLASSRKAVLLEVRADNVAAQALYASRSFRSAGVRRGYYPGGMDALVLRRPASVGC